jgi:hypothetical protein
MKCTFCNRKTSITTKSEYMIDCFCETCKAQFLYNQDYPDKKFILDRVTLQTVIDNKQYLVSMYKDISYVYYVKNQHSKRILTVNLNLNLTPFNINNKLKTIIIFS